MMVATSAVHWAVKLVAEWVAPTGPLLVENLADLLVAGLVAALVDLMVGKMAELLVVASAGLMVDWWVGRLVLISAAPMVVQLAA